MKLEIGKTYVNGFGDEATISGVTKEYPDWVWSRQGNWYVRATGQYVTYGRKMAGMNLVTVGDAGYGYTLLPESNYRTLVAEAPSSTNVLTTD